MRSVVQDTRVLPRLVVLLACLVLLAACGGGDEDEGDQRAGVEEFGLTEHELTTRIEAVEARIAGCMTAAGFEYVPTDAVTVRAAMRALGTVKGLSDEDYVSQYGYGITTQFDNPGRANVLGERNARTYEQLPPAQKLAYERALLGEDTTATFAVTLDREDFSATGGCTRAAVEQTFSGDQLASTYLNPIDARVEAHPRMVAAQQHWSDCMRRAGFDYRRQDDAERDLAIRLRQITGGADPRTLDAAAQDALKKLQGEERAVAKADMDCAEKHLEEVEAEVEFEVTGRAPK